MCRSTTAEALCAGGILYVFKKLKEPEMSGRPRCMGACVGWTVMAGDSGRAQTVE